MIRRSSWHLELCVLAAAVTVSGCFAAVPSRQPDSSPPASYAVAARNSPWAQYAWQEGSTCRLRTVAGPHRINATMVRSRGVGTVSLANAFPSAEGMSYVVSRSDKITITRQGAAKPVTETVGQRNLYSISREGVLTIQPQSQDVNGFVVQTADPLEYPAVDSTHPITQTVHASATSSKQNLANAVQQITSDGAAKIALELTWQQRMVPVHAAVSTPAGRYTDVVALRRTLVGVKVLNVAERAAAQAFAAGLRAVDTPMTTWYARNVGPIMSRQAVGHAASVEKLLGCSASPPS